MANFIAQKSVRENKMQILGHELVAYKPLVSINSIDEIKQMSNSNMALFEFDSVLINYVQEQKQDFALHVFNEIDAIIGNAVGASILICPFEIASKIQNLAEYYLFDAKIAIIIDEEKEIKKAIDAKVDMAILPNAII